MAACFVVSVASVAVQTVLSWVIPCENKLHCMTSSRTSFLPQNESNSTCDTYKNQLQECIYVQYYEPYEHYRVAWPAEGIITRT